MILNYRKRGQTIMNDNYFSKPAYARNQFNKFCIYHAFFSDVFMHSFSNISLLLYFTRVRVRNIQRLDREGGNTVSSQVWMLRLSRE